MSPGNPILFVVLLMEAVKLDNPGNLIVVLDNPGIFVFPKNLLPKELIGLLIIDETEPSPPGNALIPLAATAELTIFPT